MNASTAIFAALMVLGALMKPSSAVMTNDPKCHRLRTLVDEVRRHCVYLCHMPEGYIRMGLEEDGTPCRFFVYEGACQRGLCYLQSKRRKDGPEYPEEGKDKEVTPESPKEAIKEQLAELTKLTLDDPANRKP